MNFIEFNIEDILLKLNKLTASNSPTWGTMSAQKMVEHLSEYFNISIKISNNKISQNITDDLKIKEIIYSDSELAKNIKLPNDSSNEILRNDELELSIDEFVDSFLNFEEFYEKNPDFKSVHPIFGLLDYSQWKRFHCKHITHHFKQFGLI